MKREIKGFIIGIVFIMVVMVSIPGMAESVSKSIDVIFNSINITVNSKAVVADNILYNNTTYIPLRAVSEMLGKEVTWDQDTDTAGINDKVVVISTPTATPTPIVTTTPIPIVTSTPVLSETNTEIESIKQSLLSKLDSFISTKRSEVTQLDGLIADINKEYNDKLSAEKSTLDYNINILTTAWNKTFEDMYAQAWKDKGTYNTSEWSTYKEQQTKLTLEPMLQEERSKYTKFFQDMDTWKTNSLNLVQNNIVPIETAINNALQLKNIIQSTSDLNTLKSIQSQLSSVN